MYVVWLFGISASVYHWSVLLFIVWCLRTFNNISVISWWSVISVEETKRPGKNHRPVASHWQTLSHNVAHLPWSRFELTTSAVIDNDCKGNNYNQYWCLWLELSLSSTKVRSSISDIRYAKCHVRRKILYLQHIDIQVLLKYNI